MVHLKLLGACIFYFRAGGYAEPPPNIALLGRLVATKICCFWGNNKKTPCQHRLSGGV